MLAYATGRKQAFSDRFAVNYCGSALQSFKFATCRVSEVSSAGMDSDIRSPNARSSKVKPRSIPPSTDHCLCTLGSLYPPYLTALSLRSPRCSPIFAAMQAIRPVHAISGTIAVPSRLLSAAVGLTASVLPAITDRRPSSIDFLTRLAPNRPRSERWSSLHHRPLVLASSSVIPVQFIIPHYLLTPCTACLFFLFQVQFLR